MADAILHNLRAGDTSYRYGGEEFLIILPEQTLETTRVAADRLRQTVEEFAIPHEVLKSDGVVTVSCGLAQLSSGESKTIEKLLKEADAVLYQAKESGKNRVAVSNRSSTISEDQKPALEVEGAEATVTESNTASKEAEN